MENLIQDPEEIRLNERNQIQSILGRPPRWILRWGITFVGIFISILIGVACIVKYPDIIEARVKMVTENPPLHLVAQTSGKLTELLVADKEEVSKDQMLAVIENPADWEDVLALEKLLEEIDNNINTNLPNHLALGELQEPFSNFLQNRKDFDFFKEKKEVRKKVKALRSKIRYLGRKNLALKEEVAFIEKEILIKKDKVKRYDELLSTGNISKQEAEEANADVLLFERNLNTIKTKELDNKMQIKDFELQIIDLESGRAEDSNSKQLELDDNVFSLQGAIDEWKKQYLIYAPMEGQVSFSEKLIEQQFVKEGEELLTIVPLEGVGEIVGNALLPSDGFGKVKKDFNVFIRLDAYPYKEFGSVKATIKSIPLTPQADGFYLVDLFLPEKFISTNPEKEIVFQQEMEGTARIITKDKTIMSRILEEFIDAFKNE